MQPILQDVRTLIGFIKGDVTVNAKGALRAASHLLSYGVDAIPGDELPIPVMGASASSLRDCKESILPHLEELERNLSSEDDPKVRKTMKATPWVTLLPLILQLIQALLSKQS